MVNVSKAYRIGFSRGRSKGASISPRQAYRRGYRAGMIRKDRQWTKRAAAQSHYYYNMGKNSHN